MSSSSRSYLRALAAEQYALAGRIASRVPGADIRWHYSVVLNGLAVSIPRGEEETLAAIPGVARVWPSVRYHALLDRTPQLINAPSLWGAGLATAGNGIKIAIVDDGIDQSHPFFSARGFSYPSGFPKGQRDFTTPKVIVARAFAPAGPAYRYARRPFDPKQSEHATHVAGIAGGDNNTNASGVRISGVAPRAFLGNYKALTIPTPGFGLDGNSPEIAAAVEAAVRDGMDVINLSLGEPEIEPSRDLVVRALNSAADAGVIPVVAAGNDHLDFGDGSIGSPASAEKAISVAAASGGAENVTPDVIANFSSAGPTPYSLQMKPDVTAPGVEVLSSVPARDGLYTGFSGTSMASPHVAGGAALLRQRHPSWTVAQIKSALESTAVRVNAPDGTEAPPTRQGGGRIDLLRANDPLLFTEPTGLSFGFVRPGQTATRSVALSDAGGGAGLWTVGVQGPGVTTDPAVNVPGTLAVTASGGVTGEKSGFVLLRRNGATRRIPFWYRVSAPQLGLDSHRTLSRPGVYSGTLAGSGSRVSDYRYPDLSPTGFEFPIHLAGPESVYRLRITGRPANFGVAIVSRASGVSVEPRIVRAADENLLAGYTSLPLDLNPYRSSYGRHRLVAGVDLPAAGVYDVVFDSTAASRRGGFTFRFWRNDRTPPRLRLLSTRSRELVFSVTDAGAGVDPTTLAATIDGRRRGVSFRGGRAVLSIAGLSGGRHRIVLSASDYQETKNMEDVGGILPNTATFALNLR